MAIQEKESGNKLLLKDPWPKEIVYFGCPAAASGKPEAEADEINLSGPFCA